MNLVGQIEGEIKKNRIFEDKISQNETVSCYFIDNQLFNDLMQKG